MKTLGYIQNYTKMILKYVKFPNFCKQSQPFLAKGHDELMKDK